MSEKGQSSQLSSGERRALSKKETFHRVNTFTGGRLTPRQSVTLDLSRFCPFSLSCILLTRLSPRNIHRLSRKINDESVITHHCDATNSFSPMKINNTRDDITMEGTTRTIQVDLTTTSNLIGAHRTSPSVSGGSSNRPHRGSVNTRLKQRWREDIRHAQACLSAGFKGPAWRNKPRVALSDLCGD